jgi:hypothetical protein
LFSIKLRVEWSSCLIGIGSQSNKNKTNQNECGNKTQEEHNTRETPIYVVHLIWAMSMEKQPVLPLFHPTK